jgi:hypothetical protein
MDFRLKNLIYPKTCFWINAFLLKETRKAILIMFDGNKVWLPKAWILRIRRIKDNNAIRIKISEYYWIMKFF